MAGKARLKCSALAGRGRGQAGEANEGALEAAGALSLLALELLPRRRLIGPRRKGLFGPRAAA